MAGTERAQVLLWGILGNWRLAPAPRAWPLSLVPQHACPSLLHASSGSFPCEPGHVASPAGMRGGGVRQKKRAGSPLSTMSSWPLRTAGACSVPGPGAQQGCALGQRGKDHQAGLRWERLRIVNRKDRTHVLAVQQKQPLGVQEGETEKAREELVIYVPSWFSIVDSLRTTPIPCLQASPSSWRLFVGSSSLGDSH